MMKKTILSVFVAAIATGAILAVFCLVQFNGNAVREPSELYVSSRSCCGTGPLSGSTPAGSIWKIPSSPATTS